MTAIADRPESIPSNELVLYVVKATPTSTANTVKPLILLKELSVPYAIHVVQSTKNETWFHDVSPHRMVPAMESAECRGDKRLNIWDSTSCLVYITEVYDHTGAWKGRDVWEKTQVTNWLTFLTAGLGATGKYWLYFSQFHPVKIPEAIGKLASNISNQYDILERQLKQPEQLYVALPDRPSIADIAILPFVTEELALKAGLTLAEWPHLLQWSKKMMGRQAVKEALAEVETYGEDVQQVGPA